MDRLDAFEVAKLGYETVGVGLQGFGTYTKIPYRYNFKGIVSQKPVSIQYVISDGVRRAKVQQILGRTHVQVIDHSDNIFMFQFKI